MSERRKEHLFQVVENYFYHQNFQTDNPFVQENLESMIAVDLCELWMLTQD